eukprot:CAMPEP_0206057164 /NCGR_PEP_ID=MMETSP1466-20131121/43796_1 /ASSEMBLY_ACC=CAM_ASM_001126 /TAXON_ID=44452 /ORGANISM="Pavlova gyrans, Strain CCMP608" /LENGTH=316 /DNA_ID=CAMNT_0053432431 /DNA_START=119 /DNA_END=1069 /DNA_ORIENTATION=+
METGRPLRAAKHTTIFGCAYLQGGSAGMASYNFESPEVCYIGYKNAPPQWQSDDGTPFPECKPFLSPSYNPTTRTFTGVVDWSEHPVHGAVKWVYSMVFSESLAVISGGGLKQVDAEGRVVKEHAFPDDLVYWREPSANSSLAGSIYIQGGQLGVASYHFESETEAHISYLRAPPEWTLDNGERPPAQKPFLSPAYDVATRTFTGTIDWSPTSFAGDARWVYRMVFSEDMCRITGGSVASFRADGSRGRDLHFDSRQPSAVRQILLSSAPRLVYERFNEEMMEMRALLLERHQQRRSAQSRDGSNTTPMTATVDLR